MTISPEMEEVLTRYADADDLGEWDAGDDPGKIPPRQWLLGNQFCRGFISSLVAAGGVGKSALRLVQFISLALNRSLCGQHIFRRCRVLLISLEDDRNEVQRRIQAVLDHFDLPRSDLKGWLFCANPRAKLAELKDRQRAVGALDRQIRQAIERRKPDIVAIDPFVKLHSLGENDSADMNFVCDLLVQLAVEHELAVDIPHHVHKGQIAPGDADAGRGSSGIRDASRLTFTLTPMSEEEARAFNIDNDERLGYIRLDSAKVNITARSGGATWFHLVGVPIGNGSELYPNGDTVQVVEPWKPRSIWADLDWKTIDAILRRIKLGPEPIGKGGHYSAKPTAKTRAAWRVVQGQATHLSEAQCRQVIATWVKNGMLVEFEYDNEDSKRVWGVRVEDTITVEVLKTLKDAGDPSAIRKSQWRTMAETAVRRYKQVPKDKSMADAPPPLDLSNGGDLRANSETPAASGFPPPHAETGSSSATASAIRNNGEMEVSGTSSRPGPARPTYTPPREPDVPIQELDALREKIRSAQSALAEDNPPDDDA
jgi:hypothetical protein